MKLLIVILCMLIITTNGMAQLSKKDERIFRKSEKLYCKKKTFKAIEKLQPVLDRNKLEAKLWSAMIKFHLATYMTLIDEEAISGEAMGSNKTMKQQVDRMLNGIFRVYYYQEIVQLLEDADKNCESIENICEYIDRIVWLGEEKIRLREKNTTLFEMHKEVIIRVEENNCY